MGEHIAADYLKSLVSAFIIPFISLIGTPALKLIFDFFFGGSQVAGNLSDALILNWCLEGFRMYQEEGLTMPESVEKATQEYRDQSDRLSMFTKQCLVRKAGEELRSSAVYKRYKDWCSENGFKYENAANFKKKMAAAGYVYQRRRPWNEKDCQMSTMVNDVKWVTGEEPDIEIVGED